MDDQMTSTAVTEKPRAKPLDDRLRDLKDDEIEVMRGDARSAGTFDNGFDNGFDNSFDNSFHKEP